MVNGEMMLIISVTTSLLMALIASLTSLVNLRAGSAMLNLLVILFGITTCARERREGLQRREEMVMVAVVCEHSVDTFETINE